MSNSSGSTVLQLQGSGIMQHTAASLGADVCQSRGCMQHGPGVARVGTECSEQGHPTLRSTDSTGGQMMDLAHGLDL